MDTIDLFAIPLFSDKINLDDQKVEIAWQSVNWDRPNRVSHDMDLLNTHFSFMMPQVKSFTRTVMDTMGFCDIDFHVFRSWATITPKNLFSNYHKHTNSFLSGVIYFSDQTSPIVFENPYQLTYSNNNWKDSTYEVLKYSKNSSIVSPKKGDMIMFLSSISHAISPNTFYEDRKSIAFNVVPIGTYGQKDSKISLIPE